MRANITIPDNPIVWQCLYHALRDFENDPKMVVKYDFEIPEGECKVEIRKLSEEVNVFWSVK